MLTFQIFSFLCFLSQGCKANPNEAIVFLQRAAEFAMGELKELNPIPGSQRQQQQQQQRQQGPSSSVPSSPMTALPSSPASPSSSGFFLPGEKSESGPGSGSGSGVAPSTPQPMQQNALRRMGSLDRKAATVMARKELVMALYELGMSFLKGWGVQKDKAVAFTYFKIAADLVKRMFLCFCSLEGRRRQRVFCRSRCRSRFPSPRFIFILFNFMCFSLSRFSIGRSRLSKRDWTLLL